VARPLKSGVFASPRTAALISIAPEEVRSGLSERAIARFTVPRMARLRGICPVNAIEPSMSRSVSGPLKWADSIFTSDRFTAIRTGPALVKE
jgi:hypothetical protein